MGEIIGPIKISADRVGITSISSLRGLGDSSVSAIAKKGEAVLVSFKVHKGGKDLECEELIKILLDMVAAAYHHQPESKEESAKYAYLRQVTQIS
ncbi:MAG: hypothetical protein F4Y39_15615 [Gemmatimonadetes bacterium]|nr:hypothetical protein [Gemmatimonadota bacterium]MYF73025.1 hypothetical protein [Gemmatimonadota bacterium]MYK50991.1 hypothetical protein [Gemmatimonadota bacterium]